MRPARLRQVALVGVIFLIGAVVVVISIPPATGYELSLYDVYPWYFWGLVTGAAVAGAFVIFGSVQTQKDRSWVLGLATMLLTSALVLLMPQVRGYMMYGRADQMSHVGFVLDIVSTGGFISNIYPSTHLLILAVADATGTEPSSIAMVVPVIFSGVYFGGMFYLIVRLFRSRARILFGLPFVVLPVLREAHTSFRPFDLSLMLIPLLLYTFVKSQRHPTPSNRTALVIILISLLLYHPLTALFVIGIFLIYSVARYTTLPDGEQATPTTIFSLSAAVFVAWYTNFAGIIIRFNGIYQTLFGQETGATLIGTYTGTVEETSPALIDLIRVATFKYGIEFALFALGFIFIVVSLILMRKDKAEMSSYLKMLAATMAGLSIAGVAVLTLPLIIEPIRPWQIAKMCAVILIGQLFYLLWEKISWNEFSVDLADVFQVSLSVIMVFVVVLLTLSVYPSPLGSGTNNQVTEMEIEGSKWMTENGRTAGAYTQFGINYRRFYEYQNGVISASNRLKRVRLPAHFNYTSYSHLGHSFMNETYLTITQKGRVLYPGVHPKYPENWKFTPEDFQQLERDSTVARVYTSGDYDQYLINGTADTRSQP